MSVRMMGEAWECDLPPVELLVLMALADHADHEGDNIWPSVALIAWKTGLTDRTVKRVMKRFREIGILVPMADHPSGTVIYAMHLQHIRRKALYVAKPRGRPVGGVEPGRN